MAVAVTRVHPVTWLLRAFAGDGPRCRAPSPPVVPTARYCLRSPLPRSVAADHGSSGGAASRSRSSVLVATPPADGCSYRPTRPRTRPTSYPTLRRRNEKCHGRRQRWRQFARRWGCGTTFVGQSIVFFVGALPARCAATLKSPFEWYSDTISNRRGCFLCMGKREKGSAAERPKSTTDQLKTPTGRRGPELSLLVGRVSSLAWSPPCGLHGRNLPRKSSQFSQTLAAVNTCEHCEHPQGRPRQRLPERVLAELAVLACARTLRALGCGSRRSPGPYTSPMLCWRRRDGFPGRAVSDDACRPG